MTRLAVIIGIFFTLRDVIAMETNLISLSKEGQQQYELLMRETKMPRYGDCYQNTLKDLHDGCEELNDEIQSRLALAFTNCYLIRFGWTVYDCENYQSLELCMAHMDGRASSIYSAMLTNTLAMCHFLQGQVWHHATNRAVQSLTSTSEAVSLQLSQAVNSAAALTEKLDSQLLESRESLKSAFSDIRESTAEHRSLIIDVFERLSQLQAIVMGEFTWFYSNDMYTAIWNIRYTCILFCICILIRTALLYKDPNAVTIARLEELACVTAEIRTIITSVSGIQVSSTTLASLSRVFDESPSSDDSYSPSEESFIENCYQASHMPVKEMPVTKKYFLRTRPFSPLPQNPILALESPEAFERVVKRKESQSRRRSQTLLRQHSVLDHSCPQTNSEEIWHMDSYTNTFL